jgi:S1-C subfamily serine protease
MKPVSKLRRIIGNCVCLILLVVISFAAYLYHCADHNRMYNVVIEGQKITVFGEGNFVGSGVLISGDGLVLTAGHCVEDATHLRVTLPDGRVFNVDANSCYKDPNSDTGLIKLPATVKNYINLSNSNDVKSGDIIYNIGNAKGLWDDSIYYGQVYRNHFKRMFLGDKTEFIFAKMHIYPGCSGGGVYHWNSLVGIVVMSDGGYATFIVPSNVCNRVVKDYHLKMEKEEVTKRYLDYWWIRSYIFNELGIK